MKNPIGHWSFSSLNGLLNICSLQWKFKYIDKLESENVSSCLIFGSAIHEGATLLAQSRIKQKNEAIDEAVTCFQSYMQTRRNEEKKWQIEDDEFDELLEKGETMLRTLDSDWKGDIIIDSGVQFMVPLPNSERLLVGEVDLLVRNPEGKMIIVDWKSSATKWARDKADKDLQASLYSYAVRELNIDSNPLFRYDVITKTKKPVYDPVLTQRDDIDFKRAFKMIEVAENIVTKPFTQTNPRTPAEAVNTPKPAANGIVNNKK